MCRVTPEDALVEALQGPGPPNSVAALVELAGGRPQLARLSLGIDLDGRLPRAGTRARAAYDARRRAVERYTTTAGERRNKPDAGILRQLRAGVADRVTGGWRAKLRRRGCRARVAGDVIMFGYPLNQVMPAGHVGQVLSRQAIGAVLDLIDDDPAEAAAVFTAEFGKAYGVDLELIDDAEFIHIWLDGDEEPD